MTWRKALEFPAWQGGDISELSQIGIPAVVHGHELMKLDFAIDEFVHAYVDLCQVITDLTIERDEPFSVDQFRTLNRCLDNAIADVVNEFNAHTQAEISRRQADTENERLGVLVHELRDSLQTATPGLAALDSGALPISGSTGAMMRRSLGALSSLLGRALGEVKATPSRWQHSLPTRRASRRQARTPAVVPLAVPEVDASVAIAGNRDQLLTALVNLLQNAFKFTHSHTEVTLYAYVDGD